MSFDPRRFEYHAGELPASLGQLASPETLDLSDNQLSGEFLRILGAGAVLNPTEKCPRVSVDVL